MVREFAIRGQRSVIYFLTALQFLTVAPPIVRRMFTPQELGRSVAYYPLVGVLLGVLLAGLDKYLTNILPGNVIAVLVLAAWVFLTGALHLDGFLDSCDGLFGGHSPEQRLEIMRDERVGAFGLAGGVLLLLLKYTALVALPVEGGLAPNRAAALLLVPTLGRWAMSSVVVAFPYARSEGLGRVVKDRSGPKELALATVFALVIAGLTASWLGWVAVVVAGVLGWGVARFALARVQGLTGDLYGAVCEIVEAAMLLFLALELNV